MGFNCIDVIVQRDMRLDSLVYIVSGTFCVSSHEKFNCVFRVFTRAGVKGALAPVEI